MTETITINLRNLRQLVDQYFNDDDLALLCFDLGVDIGHLSGDNKSTRLASLISYLNTRSRLDELLEIVGKDRPHLQSQLDELINSSELVEEAPDDSLDSASLDALGRSLQRGRLLIFLGGDLPMATTGVPSRQMLADALARSEDLKSGQPLTAVSEQVMQSGNRFIFTQFIREQLDVVGLSPKPFHQLVAGLVQENHLATVVTTAYDSLLEQAFRQAGLPLTVVVNDADLSFTMPGQPTLLKLFGDWQQPASLVVTGQDQNHLLNGRSQDKQAMLDHVKMALRMQTVLFIGVDLRETAVSMLFDTVTGGQFQQPAYALWSGLSEQQIQSWHSNRNLSIIPADANAYLQALL